MHGGIRLPCLELLAKILAGTNRRANRRDYWSECQVIGQPGFPDMMQCNPFENIEQYFHVSERSSELEKDSSDYVKLCKIYVVLDTFSEICTSAYTL